MWTPFTVTRAVSLGLLRPQASKPFYICMCSFHSLFCYLEGVAIAVVMRSLDSEFLGALWFGKSECSSWPWKSADYWGQQCLCVCLRERNTFLSPHKILKDLFLVLTAYPTFQAFLSNDNCKEITAITKPSQDISWSVSLCLSHSLCEVFRGLAYYIEILLPD